MTLKFNAKTHRYFLDGRPIPGVTTLLGKGLPKPALPYWAAKSVAEYVADNPDGVEAFRSTGRGPMVAALKEIPWQKRDEAAVRGTDVHALAEELVHGRPVEVPEHLAGHVEGYSRWLDTFAVEPVLTERPVASRQWWYAGTFDLIARIDGETWGLDVKTSKAVYGETALQIAAYMTAEFYQDHDGAEVPLPEVERMGVIHVTDYGTQMYPLGDRAVIDKAAATFRHVAYIAKQTDWIKGLIGDPMPEPGSETAA